MLKINRRNKYRILVILALFCLNLPVTLYATDTETDNESEGLQLHSQSRHVSQYILKDIALSDYDSFTVDPISIEFKDNWLKDFNRKQSLTERLDDNDLRAIKEKMAMQFMKTFKKELAAEGDYRIVDTPSGKTLLIKPAMTELVITSPAKETAIHKSVYVKRAGSATLTLHLVDASNGKLVAKIIDHKKTHEHIDFIKTNALINNSEFAILYEAWAKSLKNLLKK